MASVFDVAKYILEQTGPISTIKLQKLVFYSQAWSLVWDEYPNAPLFEERIEAWANGPVIPALFQFHKGRYNVSAKFFAQEGNTARLTQEQRETIDGVIQFYGKKSAQWLSDLAHSESPWLDARKGIPEGQHGDAEITLDSMQQYYGSL